jgi:hypothetical protein
VTADDKRSVRSRLFTELFLTYGAGAQYCQRLTRAKAWNLISWFLIAIGALGWVVFLMWKPY